MKQRWLVGGLTLALVSSGGLAVRAAGERKTPEFRRHVLDSGQVWNGLAVADLNGDGKPDVVAAGPNEFSWYGREGERWERHRIAAKSAEVPSVDSICISVYDLDADGDPDLVASTPGNGTLAWYQNPKDVSKPWTRHLIAKLPRIHSQALEDVEGDGRPELVANTEGKLVYFALPRDPGASGATWEAKTLTQDGVTGTPHYLHTEQIPGQTGKVLCAGAPDGAYLAWWQRSAGAEWQRHAFREGIPGATHLRILDINGDGKPDVFYSRGHEAGSAWLAGPQWTEETVVDGGTLREPHALDLGDLNGDGAPDVAAVARNRGGLVIWINDGQGRFTRQQLDGEARGMDLQARDVDGDGDTDLLIAGATGNNLLWFENTLK
jgi:hypothetical protein